LERRLADALAARLAAEAELADRRDAVDAGALALLQANEELADVRAQSTEAQRRIAVLNEQIAALRRQLGGLQALLDASDARDTEARVQIETLGTRLNAALAQVAAEQRRRAELEAAEAERLAAEAARLAAEARNLERYRSEFFGRLREVLEGREGVRIDGDRFVFSSEVLFEFASADLAEEGLRQIENVAGLLLEIADEIPPEIDWIIRVDGHTDNVPIGNASDFGSNWQLSQARALSVVLYLSDVLGIPPDRLLAAGFGEHRPVVPNDTPEGRAQNRRIELKLTER